MMSFERRLILFFAAVMLLWTSFALLGISAIFIAHWILVRAPLKDISVTDKNDIFFFGAGGGALCLVGSAVCIGSIITDIMAGRLHNEASEERAEESGTEAVQSP
jgi:hypothetical protein